MSPFLLVVLFIHGAMSAMRAWLAGFILLVTGCLIFAPSMQNPFVFDDEEQVVNNVHVQNYDFKTLFSSSSFNAGGAQKMSGNYYKPIMTSYYAAIYYLFGLEPMAYRIPMLLLHIFSAIIIFLLFQNHLSESGAFLLSAIFLIHPVNAEVVLYIADAQDILYMFFGLCSLLALQRWTGPKMIASVSVTLILSLLSKETGALFLPITALYAYFFQREKLKAMLIVTGTIAAAYLYLRWSLGLTRTTSSQLLLHHATWLQRMQTVPLVLWHYLEIFFAPLRLSLTTDFVVKEVSVKDFWLPLLGLAIFLGWLKKMYASIQNKQDRTLFKFFLCILTLWFLLHGQILIPLDGLYADRWFYLGTIALTGLILVWLKQKNIFNQKTFRISCLVVLCLLGARNYARGLDWSSGLSLYRAELRVHPNDPLMNNNVGVELFRAGKLAEAKAYFEKSVEQNPYWTTSWNNLGALQERFNQPEEALKSYENSIRLGDYQITYENYPKLLFKMGQKERAQKFVFEQALPRFPNSPILIEFSKYLSTLSTGHQ